MKKCRVCNEIKDLSEFHKHSKMRDGHLNLCRVCRNVYVSEYRKRKGWKVRGWDTHAKQNERAAKRRARMRSQICLCCVSKDLIPLYEKARIQNLEVDHIIPISRGGLHCKKNLQLLSIEENRHKFNHIGY